MKRKKAIEYSNENWNPYSGCYNWENGNDVCGLGKDCWFYSMSLRLKGRFGYDADMPWQPTFHPDKLDKPLNRKKPTIWACCFMGEIGYCEADWMERIIDVIERCPQHTFIFLTKMPLVIRNDWPDNVWIGVTVESQQDTIRIEILRYKNVIHKFVSFEPLKGYITANLEGIEGIAIGAQTGQHPFQPDNAWVSQLLGLSRKYDCKVVLKENLRNYNTRIEWP